MFSMMGFPFRPDKFRSVPSPHQALEWKINRLRIVAYHPTSSPISYIVLMSTFFMLSSSQNFKYSVWCSMVNKEFRSKFYMASDSRIIMFTNLFKRKFETSHREPRIHVYNVALVPFFSLATEAQKQQYWFFFIEPAQSGIFIESIGIAFFKYTKINNPQNKYWAPPLSKIKLLGLHSKFLRGNKNMKLRVNWSLQPRVVVL